MTNFKEFILGKPKDPFALQGRRHIALIAIFAWVGLGADGLSSSCYGPALGYLALGRYHHLALFLAILTAFTVFLIALSYNQVIELFPNGGGGYKVSHVLLGPYAGLLSGSALLIDYLLTITISVVAGIEAVFSLLPLEFHQHKILVEVLAVLFLMYLNIRGLKESVQFLLPIFFGFFISHVLIIVYGIAVHGGALPSMISGTVKDTHEAVHSLGFLAVLAVLLRAYSLGSGTYTGLEAVSNNVNVLAEPRVRTGRITMFYMALSLSFTAGGLIVLYLLWHVKLLPGMTLNASVFQEILGTGYYGHLGLILLLFFEAGLLFIGANTGFLGGPAVLANMANDDWVPRRFSALSSRLVKQNGLLFFGLLAALLIILTGGDIYFLVIFYSINVFITFSVSLFGLCVYWWKKRLTKRRWFRNLALSLLATAVCFFILMITIFTKIKSGSWIAVLTTVVIMVFCYFLKKYYVKYEKLKVELDKIFDLRFELPSEKHKKLKLDCNAPTAVFLVKDKGAALHTILWVERMFPKHFKNYIFLSYGVIDTNSFGSEKAMKRLMKKKNNVLDFLTSFSEQNGIASEAISGYGTDAIEGVKNLSIQINNKFSNTVYFASQYVYSQDNLLSRFLHSDFALMVQRRLQSIGTKMLIVPLNLKSTTMAKS